MKKISKKKKKRSKFYNIRVPKRDPIVTSFITYLPLNRGLFAMVDTEDLEKVKHFTWNVAYIKGRPYAETRMRETREQIRLHRLIMGAEKGDGKMIDHINGRSLDCRKQNMRFCTYSENNRNAEPRPHSSKYKGVTKRKRKKGFAWQAFIRNGGNPVCLGTFDSEVEAALAYDEGVTKIDPLAFLNFPKTQTIIDLNPNSILVN